MHPILPPPPANRIFVRDCANAPDHVLLTIESMKLPRAIASQIIGLAVRKDSAPPQPGEVTYGSR